MRLARLLLLLFLLQLWLLPPMIPTTSTLAGVEACCCFCRCLLASQHGFKVSTAAHTAGAAAGAAAAVAAVADATHCHLNVLEPRHGLVSSSQGG